MLELDFDNWSKERKKVKEKERERASNKIYTQCCRDTWYQKIFYRCTKQSLYPDLRSKLATCLSLFSHLVHYDELDLDLDLDGLKLNIERNRTRSKTNNS